MALDTSGDSNGFARGIVLWAFKALCVAVVGSAFALASAAYVKAQEAAQAVACLERDIAYIRQTVDRIESKLDSDKRR